MTEEIKICEDCGLTKCHCPISRADFLTKIAQDNFFEKVVATTCLPTKIIVTVRVADGTFRNYTIELLNTFREFSSRAIAVRDAKKVNPRTRWEIDTIKSRYPVK